MRLRRYLMLLLFAACSMPVCCGENDDERQTWTAPLETCLEGEQLKRAVTPAGFMSKMQNRAVVPMGRKLTPVGMLVDVAYFPLGVAFSPSGDHAFVVHSGQWKTEVVDTRAGAVMQTVPDVGGFRGLAVLADGGSVYTTEAARGTVTKLVWVKGELRPSKQLNLDGVPTDLELTNAQDRLIVVSAANSSIWELDSGTMQLKAEYRTRGVYPYALALSPDDAILFVTHVGDDTVTAIDRKTGQILENIQVGLNPMGLAVDKARNMLYSANTDSDTLSVISIAELAVTDTIDVSGHEDALPGGTPNELALSPDGESLFVSFADLNRVDIFSPDDWKKLGSIPTAHYPTGIAVSADGTQLAVVSSKGWGGAFKLKKETSVLSLIDLPIDDSTLELWSKMAEENVMRTTQFWDSQCPDPVPLPLDQDEEQVIEHSVIIVRENKTYDAVLGDFERGNGDVKLTVLGEEFTPNLHEIARQFVNLDNYYADSQESFQGHTWTTQADCNDFFEKIYPSDAAQVLLAGWDPSAIIAERTIFDHLFNHGVTFRNYGEFEGFTKDMFTLYKDFIDMKFPYYNLAIKDVWKAEEFIRELDLGIFPEFVYIALPNDHTAGAKPGFPTPASMVADNDEATGMVVEAISLSPYWDNTIIFIIEDDPQGYGGDHVHSHRSVCVVASPWVRREFTSSVHYSIPAMYRTIEMLLRVPPMHKNDAFAPPMYDIFLSGDEGEQPDAQPYEHIPRLFPERFNAEGDRMAEESKLLDFSRPDAAPGLGYIIWRVMKGDEEPPPYAKWTDK